MSNGFLNSNGKCFSTCDSGHVRSTDVSIEEYYKLMGVVHAPESCEICDEVDNSINFRLIPDRRC